MRKIYFLFVTLCAGLLLQAQTIQVGNGTTTSGQSPFDPYYGYSYAQTIYTAAQIAGSGNITSIQYYFAGASLANSQAVKVYMATVSRSAFTSSTNWEPLSNLTLVYDGNLGTPTLPGWVTINLTTPYAYNGTGNLLVAVDENTAGFEGTVRFQGTNTGADRVLYARDDDAANNPNPASPPAGSLSQVAGNIRITGLTLACQSPTAITVTAFTTTTATVSWTAPTVGPSTTGYQYELRTTGAAGSGSTGLVASGTQTATTVNFTGLTANTTYTLYVRSACGTASSSWVSGSFATECNAITTFPHTQSFDATPACWRVAVISGTAAWAFAGSSGSLDIPAPQAGAGFAYKPYNTSTSNLSSPAFSLASFGSTQARISFWFYRHSASVAADQAKFYINTNRTLTGATQLLTLKTLTTEAPAVSAAGWYNYTVNIPTSFNSVPVVHFIVEGITTAGSSSYDIGLDEFMVEAVPACQSPTGLAVTPTTTTASFSWTASASNPSNGYQWEVRSSGAAGSSPTGLAAQGNTATGVTTATASALTANTAYTLYVRSVCGAGTSTWASFSFGTRIDCNTTPVLTDCTVTAASIAAGPGTWDFGGTYPTNSAGWNTPGREILYRFTPASTGVYYLDVTASNGEYIDYLYKPASGGCSATGWIGIDDISGGGKRAIGLLQANVEYYLLLDAENATTTSTHSFRVCKATTAAPTTLNACTTLIGPGGAVPANSTRVEHLIDEAGNLVASLDFSGVSNAVGLVTGSYYVSSVQRRDGVNREYLNRNFTITTGTTPASAVGVRLYFLNSELQTLINEPNDGIADVASISDLRVTKTNQTCATSSRVGDGGTFLSPVAAAAYDAATSYVTVNVSSFSTFYLHGGLTVLPANLLTFSGQRQGTANQLKWTVAQENNVLAYEVERSNDGRDWTNVGSVASLGNTTAQRNYSFTDNNITGLKQQYRLRILDHNATEKLSGVVIIGGAKPTSLAVSSLFPNPVLSQVSMVVDAPAKEPITITVVDAVGRIVKTQKGIVEAGSNTLGLDVATLSQGSYLVRIVSEESKGIAIGKFVKN